MGKETRCNKNIYKYTMLSMSHKQKTRAAFNEFYLLKIDIGNNHIIDRLNITKAKWKQWENRR